MRDGLQGKSYLEELDCLGTVLLVKAGGLAERVKYGWCFMADGLVEVENRKGSGMTTGILEAGSTGAQTLPMASNKVLPELLIANWLLSVSETRRHRLDFLSTWSFGAFE